MSLKTFHPASVNPAPHMPAVMVNGLLESASMIFTCDQAASADDLEHAPKFALLSVAVHVRETCSISSSRKSRQAMPNQI
jgi:hypothetical protein